MFTWTYHSIRSRVSSWAERQAPLQRARAWYSGSKLIRFVAQIARALDKHDASHMAAGVSYYTLLSLFPLLLGLTAVFGLVLNSEGVRRAFFDFVSSYMPGSQDLLRQNVDLVVRTRGIAGIVSIVGLIWSGSAMFGAVSRAVNRAWGMRKARPFYIAKPRQFAMALSVAVLFALSFGGAAAVQFLGRDVLARAGLSAIEQGALDYGARALSAFLTLGIFVLIYRFIPNTRVEWGCVWPGALLATGMFEIAKSLFLVYVHRFANYEAVYGSLGSIIALLVWVYLSAYILIIGAEVCSQRGLAAEQMAQEEKQGARDRERGRRGAEPGTAD